MSDMKRKIGNKHSGSDRAGNNQHTCFRSTEGRAVILSAVELKYQQYFVANPAL